jgi:GNAT superfamily N-acetyltransferase
LSDSLSMRRAAAADISAILHLLADDHLGKLVNETPRAAHLKAFAAIMADPNQILAVACLGQSIIGCLQLTFVPGLSLGGQWRCMIEGVRIARHLRGQGHGHVMLNWTLSQCQERGAGMVQLMADERRADATRFYESLGFRPSHVGFRRDV